MRELFSRLKVQLMLAVAVVGSLAIADQASAAFLVTPSSANYSASYNGTAIQLLNEVKNGAIGFTNGATPVLYGVGGSGQELPLASAPLKDNVETTFSGGPTSPPSEALLHIHDVAINVTLPSFLLVKDGLSQPGYYLFNLSALGYTGVGDIKLQDFWPGTDPGRIDFVALFGYTTAGGAAVPEPASLSMLAIGLGCVVGRRAFRRAKQ